MVFNVWIGGMMEVRALPIDMEVLPPFALLWEIKKYTSKPD